MPSETGTVKFYRAEKGYGFILRDGGGPDAFVHISAVVDESVETLVAGQRVRFEERMDPRKNKMTAVNVVLL
jgi:CspA family cold shock protein